MQTQATQQANPGHIPPAVITEPPPRRLYTLKAFAERHSSFLTLAALTNQVFKAKSRQSTKGEIPGNGLEDFGAIVRLNGRVLIDENAYFLWVDAQSRNAV